MGLKDILRIAEDAVNLKTKTQGQRRTKKNNKDPGTCGTQLEIQHICNWNSKGQKRKSSIEKYMKK